MPNTLNMPNSLNISETLEVSTTSETLKPSALLTNDPLTELLLLASAYRQTASLASAIELKLFQILDQNPKDLSEISTRSRIPERGLEKLLGVLIGLGLVAKSGASYMNTPTASLYLIPNKDLYLGDGILLLKDLGEKTWSTLTASLKLGAPVGHQRTAEPDAEFWRNLTRAIRPLTQPVAESVSTLLQFKGVESPFLLDLAGGSGVFGQKFLKRFPQGRVLQVDWPGVNALARQYAEREGVLDRFATEDSNLMEGHWTQGSYDAVVLSHFLHQESNETALQLLSQIKNCLKKDGYLIINEYCLNDDKTGPKYGLLFALSMAIQNEGGDSYSISEYIHWMEKTGFSVDLIYSPSPPSTVILGRNREKGAVNGSLAVTVDRTPSSFTDRFWDRGSPVQVERDLLRRMRTQLQFAQEHVEYWRKRIPNELIQAELTYEKFVELPLLHKSEIKKLDPYALVPENALASLKEPPFYLFRGTGGTTGKPTGIFWTKSDWNAAIETSVRYLDSLKEIRPLIAWNGYHQSHVSGPAFDDIIRMLGGLSLPRHFRSSDKEALDEIAKLRANALIITPQSGSGKGGSLEDLLMHDPDFLHRLKIRALLVSSTPLSTDLIQEVKQQGVEQIYNFYGSTEAFPSGISCRLNPTSFHLCQGHLFVEVLKEDGRHVKSGETGLIAVSRIGSSGNGLSENPSLGPNQGTQLFRYLVGDSATYIEDPCSCGNHNPRIQNISRIKNLEDKIRGGCEKWE